MFRSTSTSPLRLALFGILIFSGSMLSASSAFFEKMEAVYHNLYKVSADELRLYLDVSYENPPLISAEDLKARMESDAAPFVINVLPLSLYEDCHIAGSHSAPLKGLVDQAKEWEKDRSIIVYCALSQCDAAEKAYIVLSEMGFTNVIEYKGGIKEWYQLGYPSEGPAESSYLHMKSISLPECDIFPELLVCSRQTNWTHKYKAA